ncbi:MAG: TRAP transporter small permease [Oscillibacter sp.]|nr:TRAP transporter small permease [Oscillibacter sp.]
MKKILAYLTKVENFIMIVTFTIMVIASFLQVVNRNITKFSISWFDEAATYCMIYMVLIGTEMGLRDGTQIAVTGVVDKLHGGAKIAVQILAKIVVVAFSFIVFLGGVQLMNIQIRTGQVSAALNLPMSVPYAAMVISFAMITLVQTLDAVGLAVRLIKSDTEEGTNT